MIRKHLKNILRMFFSLSIVLVLLYVVISCGQKQQEEIKKAEVKTESTVFEKDDLYSNDELELYIDAPDVYEEALLEGDQDGGWDDDKKYYHYYEIKLSDNTSVTCEQYRIRNHKIHLQKIICREGGEQGYLKEVIASKYAVYKITTLRIENRDEICGK